MIKLNKVAEPQILTNNEAHWTKVVADKLAKGEEPTDAEKSKYRHPEIKVALITETSGKCAYCESKILHIAFGDVEHIEPKSKTVQNLFKWNNLTLACDRCNTYKSNVEQLFDPYAEDPADAFEFLGPMVVPHPSHSTAVLTERVLRLNRAELRERRVEKIKYLADQLLILKEAKNDDLRRVLQQDLVENELADSQEFAAIARSFLKIMLPKVADKEVIDTVAQVNS